MPGKTIAHVMTTVYMILWFKGFMFLSAGSSAGVNLLYTDVCTIGRSCTAIQVGHILHSMQASHFLGCSESAWSSLPMEIRSVTRLERAQVPFLPWLQPNYLGLLIKKNFVKDLSCWHWLTRRGWEMVWWRERWGARLAKHQGRPGTVQTARDRPAKDASVKFLCRRSTTHN